MSNFHRLSWIDAQIRAGQFPNCRTIAEKFEISTRQASRDVEYLRYLMGAPIEYSPQKNGYYYSDSAFVLPTYFISEDEKQALSFLAYQYRNLGSEQALKLAELFGKLSGEEDYSSKSQTQIPVVKVRQEDLTTFTLMRKATQKRAKGHVAYMDPFIARVEFTRQINPEMLRLSVTTVGERKYEIAYYDSEEMLSALLAQPVEFRILSPNWLKERLKERLETLLQYNRE